MGSVGRGEAGGVSAGGRGRAAGGASSSEEERSESASASGAGSDASSGDDTRGRSQGAAEGAGDGDAWLSVVLTAAEAEAATSPSSSSERPRSSESDDEARAAPAASPPATTATSAWLATSAVRPREGAGRGGATARTLVVERGTGAATAAPYADSPCHSAERALGERGAAAAGVWRASAARRGDADGDDGNDVDGDASDEDEPRCAFPLRLRALNVAGATCGERRGAAVGGGAGLASSCDAWLSRRCKCCAQPSSSPTDRRSSSMSITTPEACARRACARQLLALR